MSFDFSDLVIPDESGDNYDYSQFLSKPIYDWLNFPDAVLQACDDLEEEKTKKRKVTIIQQAQPENTSAGFTNVSGYCDYCNRIKTFFYKKSSIKLPKIQKKQVQIRMWSYDRNRHTHPRK